MAGKGTETPLMKQYYSIKAKHPDAVLLFRVGDFYETFGSDAVRAAQILGITLTKRKNGAASHIELAGFPHHSLDTYLPKLVRAGQRVAICDQLEDPKATKKIVKRGVTELVTPGVSMNDQILDRKKNNFLAAVHFEGKSAGVAFLDISTGEFLVAEGPYAYVAKLLQSFQPSEVLVMRGLADRFSEHMGDGFYMFYLDDWVFTEDFGREILLKHFKVASFKGFGVEGLNMGIIAGGACLQYLNQTQHHQIQHIRKMSRIEEDKYVWLDRFTIRNLELFGSNNENARTLFSILDHTVSPMGSRMMKRWLALPLKNEEAINQRLQGVEFLIGQQEESRWMKDELNVVGDLERLISKVAVLRINPREVVQLKTGMEALTKIKHRAADFECESLQRLVDQIDPCDEMITRIRTELREDAPVSLGKGAVIAPGVNAELDELRSLSTSSKSMLEAMLNREIEETGISSLKIGFNNVFGYYFEVRNTHKDKVPEEWIRKQTLVNAERYITEELKDYETKILGAEERINALEYTIFQELISALSDFIAPIQLNAQVAAHLDCLMSFAHLAVRQNYCRPEVNDGFAIDIHGGRHPVIEQQLPVDEEYIPNDVYLDREGQQIMMITGPNMAGKSALLRQTALITLMAQMGSFVPATKAKIGLVDKIFTRVGASDNISQGESTFMVEMNETASILNNLSDRSLILLDEIGRGTSTYDGVSIAWSIAEYLHESAHRPKTLFATHYHELNEMTNRFGRVKNFNVSIREVGNSILFVRKLVPGGSNHSFGIHVAQMAGMPAEVIQRANDVLGQLEDTGSKKGEARIVEQADDGSEVQLSFFQLDDPTLLQIKDEIQAIDVNTLTPVEALFKLNEIKKILGQK